MQINNQVSSKNIGQWKFLKKELVAPVKSTPVKAVLPKNATLEQRQQANKDFLQAKITAAKEFVIAKQAYQKEKLAALIAEQIDKRVFKGSFQGALLTQLFDNGTAHVFIKEGEDKGIKLVYQSDIE